MLKTYSGSCHCGAVRFEADIDFASGSGRCNCTICLKRRNWGVLIQPDAFRLTAGEDRLSDFRDASGVGNRPFCRECGGGMFGHGHLEQLGGDFVSVSIGGLDGLTPEELAAIPVAYQNGLENQWWDPPKVTSYL